MKRRETLMRLEFKLALINALSKVIIFLILLVLLQQMIASLAVSYTDRDLLRKKEKTMNLIRKIGIKSFFDLERDSIYASYNVLKDEYITIDLNKNDRHGEVVFSNDARVIEGEEFDFRIVNYYFTIDRTFYNLEIGKNIQIINSLNKMLESTAITIILLVLLITILFDVLINKYLLFPLNRKIIPKLKTITTPETYDYSELKSSTSDFVYLNRTLNELMEKVTTILRNQKKFTADVSHELFTPISIMQSKLENLLTSSDLPENYLSVIIDQQSQLNRLQQIIKALLLIARIENDQFVKNDIVPLRELVDEVIENIDDRAQMKGIVVENLIGKTIEIKNVNRSLMYILLFNLINNAIKYGKENGWVKIKTRILGGNLLLEVEDNGMGISEEKHATIFDRFTRIDTSSSEGFGLGLSIVKSIAMFHDANIDVYSRVNKGSVFTVRLLLKYVNE